ncbi:MULTISPECIES: hypothetical protein [unclassified Streptomyces]|uniref:hypothetical protein n=1 Tax=unclassified Streptomyces TaxID=2593676 RepID=UPI0004CA4489|nr:hypothetical protein [Streptomyces sp. NRRL F-2747]
MPIDPYAALNAMLRAEAARYTPPAPKPPRRGTGGEDAPAVPAPTSAVAATGAVNGSETPSEG